MAEHEFDWLENELIKYSEAFDNMSQQRFENGAQEYGPVTFLGNDVIKMMMEELVDTSNYCRMQFVKLGLLQEMLSSDENIQRLATVDDENNVTIGIKSFKGVSEMDWKR